jgi:hypothetical protein
MIEKIFHDHVNPAAPWRAVLGGLGLETTAQPGR